MSHAVESAKIEAREELERELEREMILRISAEVKRVEREKQDRADAKLLHENEKLRKSLIN